MTAPFVDLNKPDPNQQVRMLVELLKSPLADTLFKALGRPDAVQVRKSGPLGDIYGQLRGGPADMATKDSLDLYTAILRDQLSEDIIPPGQVPPSTAGQVNFGRVLSHELGHHFARSTIQPDAKGDYPDYLNQFWSSPLGQFTMVTEQAPNSIPDQYGNRNAIGERFAQAVMYSIDFLRATQKLDMKDPKERKVAKGILDNYEKNLPGVHFVTAMILGKPGGPYAEHPVIGHYKALKLDNPPMYLAKKEPGSKAKTKPQAKGKSQLEELLSMIAAPTKAANAQP